MEQLLGDPALPGNVMSSQQSMRLDEMDAFPEAAMAFLSESGMSNHFLPQALGGQFGSSETLISVSRALARRDMTVAVSYSTMLWSTWAWISGRESQQRSVAEWVRSHSFPCLAHSEAEHGADLAANALTARRTPDGGYVLNGEKWPINRATRSNFLVLLARTDEAHHMRNHTLLIVDKASLPPQSYYHLPRVKTHGLRGCDISGIGFRDCPVPASALFGEEGHGLEIALQGFQITRTFCTGLSLGVGDSTLRLVADFAAGRQLYGTTVDRLPHAREVLAGAYLSQLMAECVATVAARGLHLHPTQFSTWSSVAKVRVSQLVDQSTHQLAAVLGSRHFLREGHGDGMFQKFLRDGSIISVFDGSSIVCMDSLASLLPLLARRRQKAQDPGVDAAALYDLRKPLPALRFSELRMSGRGRDAVLESLPGLLELVDDVPDDDAHCPPSTLAAIRQAAHALTAHRVELDAAVLDAAALGQRNSMREFSLAQRYIELHGAVSALGLWLFNRETLGDFFAAGHWLQAALQARGREVMAPGLVNELYTRLDWQRREQHMFSLFHWPLPKSGTRSRTSQDGSSPFPG
jgi:alkylation response protein AidB-like acyl-CoA dehydrogenase